MATSTAQVGLGQAQAALSRSGNVKSLVELHETKQALAQQPSRSPSSSPTSLKRATLSPQPPTSPSPSSSLPLPPTDTLVPSAPSSIAEGSVDSMTGSGTLPDIKETVAESANGEKEESDAKDGTTKAGVPAEDAATDAPTTTKGTSIAEEDASASLPTPPPSTRTSSFPKSTSDSPLTSIVELLPSLSAKEQEVVQVNLERIGGYPRELPLSATWTLYFSDTSGAAGHGAISATKYTESRTKLFTVNSVGALCGSLKAYKKLIRSKRMKATEPDNMGLIGFRPGQNLHFFKAVPFIEPTWEDPYNAKGGRLTISPPLAQIDRCYERIVLLLAGNSLESAASDLLQNPENEGMVCGVVASRRARGDRIELWLGGKNKSSPAPPEWIDKVKEVLSVELEMPELRSHKFKKHL